MVDQILKRIKDLGLSCSSVEKKLGFGNGAIKRFDVHSPSVDKILKLANFLEIPIDYMLTGKKTAYPCTLTPNEREILSYVSLLDEREQFILIGELRERTKPQGRDSDEDKLPNKKIG